MDAENQGQPCLFGWPEMPWKGKRGKPPHVPTPENINKIKLLMAFGKTNLQIAHALGISEPTLRRYYFSVLKCKIMAREAAEAKVLSILWAQAERGNVGAIKRLEAKFEAMTRRDGAAALLKEEDEDDDTSHTHAPIRARGYVGKKQEAQDRAQRALTKDPDLKPLLN